MGTGKLDVDAILADPAIRIVVCCGSGGVGKTTTAAALAVRAAERHGRRTVVLTIDPARRLAQALGLTELAPTVYASALPVAETLAALRAAGYAPAGEHADGTIAFDRVPRHRVTPPHPDQDRS